MHIKQVSDKNQMKTIEEFAYKIWHEHYTPIIGTNQVEYMLEKFQSVKAMTEQIQNGFLYFLCEYDNKTIGYMSVNISDGALFLSKFYVASAQRGKGYGRKMISYLETLAKEKSLNRISLTVNKDNAGSINMYKKVGFVICGTAVKDIGEGFIMDDYQMEKRV